MKKNMLVFALLALFAGGSLYAAPALASDVDPLSKRKYSELFEKGKFLSWDESLDSFFFDPYTIYSQTKRLPCLEFLVKTEREQGDLGRLSAWVKLYMQRVKEGDKLLINKDLLEVLKENSTDKQHADSAIDSFNQDPGNNDAQEAVIGVLYSLWEKRGKEVIEKFKTILGENSSRTPLSNRILYGVGLVIQRKGDLVSKPQLRTLLRYYDFAYRVRERMNGTANKYLVKPKELCEKVGVEFSSLERASQDDVDFTSAYYYAKRNGEDYNYLVKKNAEKRKGNELSLLDFSKGKTLNTYFRIAFIINCDNKLSAEKKGGSIHAKPEHSLELSSGLLGDLSRENQQSSGFQKRGWMNWRTAAPILGAGSFAFLVSKAIKHYKAMKAAKKKVNARGGRVKSGDRVAHARRRMISSSLHATAALIFTILSGVGAYRAANQKISTRA